MSVSFFDSNMPLYLLETDDARALVAERLLLAGGIVSVQVCNEVAAVARRKRNLEWSRLRTFLADLTKLVDVVPLTLATHELGLRFAASHGLHIYDATIVASALEAACDILYTEDLHPGLVLDGRLTVVNPFA